MGNGKWETRCTKKYSAELAPRQVTLGTVAGAAAPTALGP